jgi:hypothetical protein
VAGPRKGCTHWPPELAARLAELRGQRVRVKVIARLVGKSAGAVREKMRRMGLASSRQARRGR